MSRDRRRFQRLRTSSGVAALLQIGGATTSVVIDNISLGGVFLRSARPMSSGTRVSMRIVRPGLKIALTLNGTVVGVLSPHEAKKNGVAPGMRISFDGVEGGSKERLSSLLIELGLPEEEHLITMPQAQPSAPVPAPFSTPNTEPGFSRPSVPHAVETVPEPRKAPADNPFAKPAPGWQDAYKIEVTVPVAEEAEDEVERLMTHVRGLLLQLSEAETKITKLEDENRGLKARIYDLEKK